MVVVNIVLGPNCPRGRPTPRHSLRAFGLPWAAGYLGRGFCSVAKSAPLALAACCWDGSEGSQDAAAQGQGGG